VRELALLGALSSFMSTPVRLKKPDPPFSACSAFCSSAAAHPRCLDGALDPLNAVAIASMVSRKLSGGCRLFDLGLQLRFWGGEARFRVCGSWVAKAHPPRQNNGVGLA
jgi:hypothetical protein